MFAAEAAQADREFVAEPGAAIPDSFGRAAVPPISHATALAAKVAASRSEAAVVTCTGGHLGGTKIIPADAVAFISRCLA